MKRCFDFYALVSLFLINHMEFYSASAASFISIGGKIHCHEYPIRGNDCTIRRQTTIFVKEKGRDEENGPISAEIVSDGSAEALEDALLSFNSIEEEMDWMPDSKVVELATQIDERLTNRNSKTGEKFRAAETDFERYNIDKDGEGFDESPDAWDDSEALIRVLGTNNNADGKGNREEGYMGDCTLDEIAMDYSVPIFYLADILCAWGVPPPIDTSMKLGDLVIGEQAYAILEAVTSFDSADMYNMFSDHTLISLAQTYKNGVELRELFQVAMSEGMALPFGVHSRLRKEYVEILDRYFDPDSYWDGDGEEYDGLYGREDSFY